MIGCTQHPIIGESFEHFFKWVKEEKDYKILIMKLNYFNKILNDALQEIDRLNKKIIQ
jgi:hypothetical protein